MLHTQPRWQLICTMHLGFFITFETYNEYGQRSNRVVKCMLARWEILQYYSLISLMNVLFTIYYSKTLNDNLVVLCLNICAVQSITFILIKSETGKDHCEKAAILYLLRGLYFKFNA